MIKSSIKLINYLFDRCVVVEKVAFYINEAYIFDHYKNVMQSLPQDKFILILAEKFKEKRYEYLIARIQNIGWDYCYLDNVFYKYKFRMLVTHIYLGGSTSERETFSSRLKYFFSKLIKISFHKVGLEYKSTKSAGRYFQKILGIYNIKFMYGLDNGSEKLEESDNMFDMIFCHGPRDSKIMSEHCNKPTYIMGYPRYDNYLRNINNNNLKQTLLSKFKCDQEKETIIWICTVTKAFSTILKFADEMEKLSSEYNIIVRPHPLEISRDSNRFNEEVFKIVHKECFILNDDPSQDMSELYTVADVVVCDYGGSVFSALYLGKNLFLLNNAKAKDDPDIVVESSMELRNIIPSIDDDKPGELSQLIRDKGYWERKYKLIEAARSHFYGKIEIASPRAASKIMQLFNESQLQN
jgi:hypothetical protein